MKLWGSSLSAVTVAVDDASLPATSVARTVIANGPSGNVICG